MQEGGGQETAAHVSLAHRCHSRLKHTRHTACVHRMANTARLWSGAAGTTGTAATAGTASAPACGPCDRHPSPAPAQRLSSLGQTCSANEKVGSAALHGVNPALPAANDTAGSQAMRFHAHLMPTQVELCRAVLCHARVTASHRNAGQAVLMTCHDQAPRVVPPSSPGVLEQAAIRLHVDHAIPAKMGK